MSTNIRPAPLAALLSAGLAAFAAQGCGEPKVQIVEATAAEHGEALFADPEIVGSSFNTYSCTTCHAAEPGEDDAILPGAPLAGAVKRSSYWGGNERELLRAVNHCLYYFMLKDDPWTADDPNARAIYAYLESLPAGAAGAEPVAFTVVEEVIDPPQGDAARGAKTYDRACASCHGAPKTGDGRLEPNASVLPTQWLEDHPSDTYTPLDRRRVFFEKVRHGTFLGYGGWMPPFSAEVLSNQDIGDVLAHLGVP